jgi:hypothetical protein
MRLTKKLVERRCRFVAKLHKQDHEMTSTEIGNKVKERFGQEMHPSMIKRVREQAEAERLASVAPAAVSMPPAPVVAPEAALVVEPKAVPMSTDMVEGLKLIKQAIFNAAQAGTVRIVATKDGKLSVSCELETRSESAFEL